MTVWLTAGEAAEYVRLKNSRLITQAIRDGDLPASNVGRTRDIRGARIKQSDLDAWLEGRPHLP